MKAQPSFIFSALAAVLAAGALVVAILAATVLDDSGQSAVPSASAPSPQTGDPIEIAPAPRGVAKLLLTVVSDNPKGGAGAYSGWVLEEAVQYGERHPDDPSGDECVQALPPPPGKGTCEWRYLPQGGGGPDMSVYLKSFVPAGFVVSWTGCDLAYAGDGSGQSGQCVRRFRGTGTVSVKASIVPAKS